MLIKRNSVLAEKVRNYIKFRYNDTRSIMYITVTKEGSLKVGTRCHRRDHYPSELRRRYRVYSVHVEYINVIQMNSLWKEGIC